MKRKGFTLVEMLLVLAVLGVLMSLGTYGMQRYVKTLRLSESAHKVQSFLAQARNQAIKRSEAAYVDVGGNTLRLYDGNDQLKKTLNLPYRSQVAPGTRVYFTGRGLPDHQYVFTVQLGDRNRSVVLLPTGKVVIP